MELQGFFEDRAKVAFPGVMDSPSVPPYRTRGAVSKLASTVPSNSSSSPVKASRRVLTSVSSQDTNDEDYETTRRPPANRRNLRSLPNRKRHQLQSFSDAEESVMSVGSGATSVSSSNDLLLPAAQTPPPPPPLRQTRSMQKRLPSSLSSSGKSVWTTDDEGFSMTLRTRSQHRKRKVEVLENSDDEEEVEEEGEEEEEEDDDNDNDGENETSVDRDTDYELERVPVRKGGGGRKGKGRRGRRRTPRQHKPVATKEVESSGSTRQLRKRCKVVSYSEDEEQEDYDTEIPLTCITSRSGRIVKPTSKLF